MTDHETTMSDQQPVRQIEELPREAEEMGAEEMGAEAAEQAKGGYDYRDKFHQYL